MCLFLFAKKGGKNMNLNSFFELETKKKVIIIIAILVVIFLIIQYVTKNNESSYNFNDGLQTSEIGEKINENAIENTNIEDEKSNIYIDISGEINHPGIVILEEGARIIDVIEAAGGITVNADITYVNLAFTVLDGMKIYIPNIKDAENFKNTYINNDSGNNVLIDNAGSSLNINSVGGASIKQKVNINTATQAELETLTGIGPSIAIKIVEYRKKNGKFNSIDDIKNVTGIGDSKFNSISDYIRVK